MRDWKRLTLRAVLWTSIIFPEPIRARVSSPITQTRQEAETIADALPIEWTAYAGVVGRKAWVGVWRDVAIWEIAVLGGGEGSDSEEESGGMERHTRCRIERTICAWGECEARRR